MEDGLNGLNGLLRLQVVHVVHLKISAEILLEEDSAMIQHQKMEEHPVLVKIKKLELLHTTLIDGRMDSVFQMNFKI